jgi:hypothetical protein
MYIYEYEHVYMYVHIYTYNLGGRLHEVRLRHLIIYMKIFSMIIISDICQCWLTHTYI